MAVSASGLRSSGAATDNPPHFGQRLGRNVRGFAGRHNIHDLDTIAQMSVPAQGMVGKQFKFDDLAGNAGVGQ